MSGVVVWSWLTVLLLGAGHGINPGMGWLFAVALGMQEGERRAVWRALPPLALGHALAIGATVAVTVLAGRMVPLDILKWTVAVVLFSFGVYRLFRVSHPRWGGMKVGARDLTIWSFLMGTAHGAGLMVLPFVLGITGGRGGGHAGHPGMPGEVGAEAAATEGAGVHHAMLSGLPEEQVIGLLATLLHTAAYLLVTGVIAVLVFEKLGLRRLRSLWINLDLVWAVALVATALVTPFL